MVCSYISTLLVLSYGCHLFVLVRSVHVDYYWMQCCDILRILMAFIITCCRGYFCFFVKYLNLMIFIKFNDVGGAWRMNPTKFVFYS